MLSGGISNSKKTGRQEEGKMLRGCIQIAIVSVVIGYFLYSTHRDRAAWDKKIKELKEK